MLEVLSRILSGGPHDMGTLQIIREEELEEIRGIWLEVQVQRSMRRLRDNYVRLESKTLGICLVVVFWALEKLKRTLAGSSSQGARNRWGEQRPSRKAHGNAVRG